MDDALGAFSSLDAIGLAVLNAHAGTYPLLDAIVNHISTNNLYKGVVAAMALAGLWAWKDGDTGRRRAGVIAAIVVSLVAIFVGRGLAKVLPFSQRPIHSGDPSVNFPISMYREAYSDLSSMPSDHAVMFFAIAVSAFLILRWVGVVLLVHALVVVCLPRVFLGVHWASDIVVGALLGTLIALVLHPPLTRALERRDIGGVIERHTVVAQLVLFFMLVQVSTMYEPLRTLASATRGFVRMAMAGA